MTWFPASELPEPGKKVLAYYKNDLGKNRIVVGFWVPEKFHEADPEFDEIGIYDEDADAYYWPSGWYESIDNWDDYSAVTVNHEVLAWMPLPEAP